jgi:hypothetical protein
MCAPSARTIARRPLVPFSLSIPSIRSPAAGAQVSLRVMGGIAHRCCSRSPPESRSRGTVEGSLHPLRGWGHRRTGSTDPRRTGIVGLGVGSRTCRLRSRRRRERRRLAREKGGEGKEAREGVCKTEGLEWRGGRPSLNEEE